ncbi:hypothetical protein ES704_03026 [subsurface metagenome]
MNIWKFLENKKEEEKEKLGSQFGGGWGIADLVKETQKEEIDVGIPKGEVKAEGALKLEDKPKSELDILDELNESIEKNYKQYQSMTKKLETYQEGYADAPDNIKPSIAANFNKLVGQHSDLIKQLEGDIGKRDQIITTAYKQEFMRYKQLTGLPEKPTFKPAPIVKPEPIIEGLPVSLPREEPKPFLEEAKKRIIGVFGTWEAKKRAMPELQKMEDFASTIIREAVPLAQSRYGEDYTKRGSYKEEIAVIHEYLTGAPRLETLAKMDTNFEKYKDINPDVDERTWLEYYKQEGLWKTLITGPTEGIYDEAEELQRQLSDIRMRVAEPGKDFIGQVGWAGVAIVMGYQGINALYKGGMTIENKVIKGEKLKQAVERIQKAYIKETGKFKATLSDNDFRIAEALGQITKRYGSEMLTGLTKMEVPQRVFMGQAGNIANLVKMIQSAGKLTPEITNQLKVMNPVDTGLVFQQLSMASPAIASKVASEFVELIPQKITKIPKVEEEMTPEELEAFERLKAAKIIPKEEVEPTKAELEAIEKPLTPKEKFIEKMKEAAEVKEKPGAIGEKFIGKAFRSETEIPEHGAEVIAKMKTAKEKLDYDYGTTANYIFKEAEKVAKGLGIDLKKVPIKEMIWVAPDPKTAEKYDGAKELELPEDTIILAKDDEGGFLVLKNTDKYIEKVEEIPREEPAKVEPEPTSEEIRTVFMDEENLKTTVKNRELFYEKYNNVYVETKEGYDKLLEEQVKNLKEEGFKGVEKGGLKRDEEGKVIGRYPTVSKNPKWYRDFYVRENKKPSDADLREIARDQLLRGHIEDYGEVSANEMFIKLEAQLDNYEAILSDIKDGDYSFETPKNIEKLNEKLKEMGKENKKIVKDLKTELATLKAEREAKYVGLKEEVEAAKKVEVEIGIKKGLKVAKAELKGRAIKGMPKEEIKEGNKLIKQIQIMVKDRGFTKKQFSDIKMTHGGARHLTGKTKRMTIPQLKAVFKAVEAARPRQIGWKKVLSLKTENKIQSLKDNLIDKLQMTEETYKSVLKDVGVYKEPRYIDAKHFITEKQGRDIIYRLIDEATILRTTLPYKQAVEKNPEIKKVIDKELSLIKPGDKKLKDPWEMNSMRVYFQKMGEITNESFYRLGQDLINTHSENKKKLHEFIEGFSEFKDVVRSEEAIKRVDDYIVCKSTLEDKPKYPKEITKQEIEMAKKVEGMLKDYEATARTLTFLNEIDHLEGMPQYAQYKKEINKAKDIYESKGFDDLVEYMKTQEFGIIKSGYSPLQVISPKVRLDEPRPTTFGKGYIKHRTDIEYKEQDKNILQRLFSYKKQMDNLVSMYPKVKALITLTDKNLDKFENPNRVKNVIELFLKELKGYSRPEGLVERTLNRAYSQSIQVIIMPSPVLSGRNLLQNPAFAFDKTILIDPRNKNLTADEVEYLNTYVSQMEVMKADWFLTGEKPYFGKVGEALIGLINKIGLYPRSDQANRIWAFWGKINQVKRAFDKDISLSKQIEEAKFSDMESSERIMALEILAKDGKEAMAKYIAKVYTDDTNFRYARYERSPAEMGKHKWFTNLMLFPRSYWELLLKHGNKLKTGTIKEQGRAFKVLTNIIVGGLIVGAAYKKATGRRENPYNPLVLLAYEPGGLAIGIVEAATDVYANTIMALSGDERAMAALTTAIPKMADMFIPFFSYTIRGYEAMTDKKNVDREALRKIRELLDKEYKVRGKAYIIERNAIEKWQYFLSGAGIDVAIKEREKEEKEKKKITFKKPEILKRPSILKVGKPKVLTK